MIHIVAYCRKDHPKYLTKCGKVVARDEVVFFARNGADCEACREPGAWPTNGQQKAADFTAPGGHVFDRLTQ